MGEASRSTLHSWESSPLTLRQIKFLGCIQCDNDLVPCLALVMKTPSSDPSHLTPHTSHPPLLSAARYLPALPCTEILLKITLFWRTWPINKSGLDILKSQHRRTQHSLHSPAIKLHLYLVTTDTNPYWLHPHSTHWPHSTLATLKKEKAFGLFSLRVN